MNAARRRPRASQRGAALLIAMVILTLVATLAAGMVWQQQRGIQLEVAERARSQAAWVLNGALDWARLILREDRPNVDHLGEPWATPLEEARLSTFLAADRESGADDGPEAFLAGRITDAQSHYNLRNLVGGDNKVAAAELATLQRLCETTNVPRELADRIANGLQSASGAADLKDARLALRTVDDLLWLGVEPVDLERLRPFIELLPRPTPVNLNTAPREVIAAVLEGMDLGTADRLVQTRQSRPFDNLDAVRQQVSANIKLEDARVSVKSDYFTIQGRLRLGDRMLEEQSLVHREGRKVSPVRRERRSAVATGSP
ncbi:type II secretory pathway, component PulK [Burkholderiales bacterium JOSHI_001]|nr:type II secretory pathway, component PulK [Burkholderiales bacterium JOSHI_001]